MPSTILYDTRTGNPLTQSALIDRLAQVDVVIVGEQHTDPATHALELELLEGLHHRAGKRLTLGMEMWERDVQPALDAYLQGKTDEAAFLKASRPWSNYQTDYRSLVEYAKASGIPILASNVPQALASKVGKQGLIALQDAPPDQFASRIQTPHDQAWLRFQAVMHSMGDAHGGTPMDDTTITRFYEAQCLRDETMADSITQRIAAAPGSLILHLNGQFHSDYGDGIPRRVLWRRPRLKVIILSIVPASNADIGHPATDKELADYVAVVPAKAR